MFPVRWRLGPLLVLLVSCQSRAPAPLRVSFVGDVLLDRHVPAALRRDSAALGRTARQLWQHSRYVVGNLECPLTTAQQPAAKRYVFRADPRYAAWLRRLGLTHLSLANNHSLDQHLPGLQDTDRALRRAGLGPLGYAPDSLAGCQPTLLGPDSSVAVFAYSALPQGIPGEGCVCGRRFAELGERLAAYKTLFPARAVLVYLHWGTEYTAAPSPAQRQQARLLIDCGADAVVGAHPHVVQTVEFYRGRPVLYSLGNFLFDQQGRATDLALQADFDVSRGRVVATRLRPLQLVGAVPRAADDKARAALERRIQQISPGVQLQADAETGRWLLRPTEAEPADTTAGFFARQLVLTDSAGGRTVARLHRLARANQYQVHTQSATGTDLLHLGFPLYHFAQGDVDNDGQPDLLVGPIKRTHFDSTVQRRLFVYRLAADGQLRPRWLGSKVVHRLLYFRALRDAAGRTFVRTIEQQPDGRYCIGRYYWQGFGLVLDRFTARGLSRDDAYLRFTQLTI